jgi:hypothetical protein
MTVLNVIIYNVVLTIDCAELNYSMEMEELNKFQTIYRFEIESPPHSCEITEDEIIDSINSDTKAKNRLFVRMSVDQLENSQLIAAIKAYKRISTTEDLLVGKYVVSDFHKIVQNLRKSGDQKSSNVFNEISFLSNDQNESVGNIQYSLEVEYIGECVKQRVSFDATTAEKEKKEEKKCLEVFDSDSDFKCYEACIGGSKLRVKVSNNSPYIVVREDVKPEAGKSNKMMEMGDCAMCPSRISSCACHLTLHQQKTSCDGRSYMNTTKLPVIRGNLKYPAQFSPSSCHIQHLNAQNACAQATIPKPASEGIKMCRIKCEGQSEVFTFKVDTKHSEIEIQMTTPRYGNFASEVRTENRQIQVNESEFGDPSRVQEIAKEMKAPAVRKASEKPAKKGANVKGKPNKK